jgi:hypothetical protein
MTEDDAGPFGGEDRLTMLQMLRDALAWQRQVGDTEAAEQTGLYRMVAHEAGITDEMIGGAEGVRAMRAAADLTDLGSRMQEQLASRTADQAAALQQAADDIAAIAERLASGNADAEARAQIERQRDPDLEEWLGRQLARARPQAAGPDDLAAIRKLAALPDGTVAEAVARWLREAREYGG